MICPNTGLSDTLLILPSASLHSQNRHLNALKGTWHHGAPRCSATRLQRGGKKEKKNGAVFSQWGPEAVIADYLHQCGHLFPLSLLPLLLPPAVSQSLWKPVRERGSTMDIGSSTNYCVYPATVEGKAKDIILSDSPPLNPGNRGHFSGYWPLVTDSEQKVQKVGQRFYWMM